MPLSLITTLGHFATSLASAGTLDELAHTVEAMLEELLPVEYSALYLYDAAHDRLRLLSARGFTEEERLEAERTAMERHPGTVFRTATMLLIPDVERDDEHLSESSPRSFVVRSRLYIPVMLKGKCIGALGIVGSGPKEFTEAEIQALTFVGDLSAVAYDRIVKEKERKEVDAELALMNHAIASSNNGVIITNPTIPDNPIVYVNPAFERMTGYSAAEVMGLNCRFLQGPDRDQVGLNELRAALKEERGCQVVLRNFRKDRTPFWTELSVSPVRDPAGRLTRYIGIQADVTKRIQADEQLRTAAARLSRLIENLHAGVLVEDSVRRIALVNQDFCTMFGIPASPDMMLGADCSQAAEQSKHLFADPDSFVRRIVEILERRERVIGDELELVDGRYFERDFIPITIEGEPLGHLWQYRDVTQRLNTQRELENSARRQQELLAIAENALEAREQFFARMSHEIRTPLNGVIGFSHALMQSGLNSDQSEMVHHLQHSAENLLVIVNDILDLSKLAAGKLTIAPRDLSVAGVLKSVLESVRSRANAKGIELRLLCDERIPDVLIGDPVRVSQVMMNLISNAVKFTERGGVELACRKIEAADGVVWIEFRCADTGIGIPQEKLPLLFESYSQVHDSGYEGTGLGLAITKQLVELMKGSIRIESQPGVGTTVTVELPFDESGNSAGVTEQVQARPVRLEGRRMLIVDDNEMNRLVLGKMLANWGVEIVEAASGPEALSRIEADAFDLIFMDVRMPGMDGVEVTRRIRTGMTAPSSLVPIVATTASIVSELRSRCLDAGMSAFLPKPFSPDALREIVEGFISGDGPAASTASIASTPQAEGIDLSYFEALADNDGSFMARALSAYLRNMHELQKAVADAAAREDLELLRTTAHTMKPLFAMCGLGAVSARCGAIEDDCTFGRLPDAAAIASVLAASDHVLRELRRIHPEPVAT